MVHNLSVALVKSTETVCVLLAHWLTQPMPSLQPTCLKDMLGLLCTSARNAFRTCCLGAMLGVMLTLLAHVPWYVCYNVSQERIRMVKRLFRDASQTEFIIATIPTVLGINESSRLLATLREEQIPCKRIIVNQVIGPNMGDAFIRLRLKDQAAALQLLRDDPALDGLNQVMAPLVDLEVRGVPALQYFSKVVWNDDTFQQLNGGELGLWDMMMFDWSFAVLYNCLYAIGNCMFVVWFSDPRNPFVADQATHMQLKQALAECSTIPRTVMCRQRPQVLLAGWKGWCW